MIKRVLSVAIVTLIGTGCVSQKSTFDNVAVTKDGVVIEELEALKGQTILSIEDGLKKSEGEAGGIRLKSVRSVALVTGISHGRRWRQKQINAWLGSMHAELAVAFNFDQLLIDGVYLPSRIDEVKAHAELINNNRIRYIRHSYRIATPPRLVLNPPTYLNYLYQMADEIEPPNPLSLPVKGTPEAAAWKQGLEEGWVLGVDQADDGFEEDLALLVRDYTGMNRYFELAQKGLVKRPSLEKDELGIVISADGRSLNVGDEFVGITADPTFNHPSQWKMRSEDHGDK